MIGLEVLVGTLFQGALMGLVYASIALGFNLVYRVSKSINFAHPAVILLVGYVALLVSMKYGVVEGLLASLLVAAVSGLILERSLARPLIGKPPAALIGATLGAYYVIRGVTYIIGKFQAASLPIEAKYYELGILSISNNDILSLAVTGFILAGIILMHEKTKIGSAIRAVAEDAEGAAGYGLPVGRLITLSWIIAGVTGAFGGLAIAIKAQVSPAIEFYAIKALAASILAGLDSIGGIIVGGLALGLIEQFSRILLEPYLPGIGGHIAFIFLLLILLVKPYGIFGTERIERI
ncbi:MAG: branched-chain amino acid ABC transporter permease [Desulfurococcales archaeon]|nr:branched-chain amino acid ABC transporter permease [Desulfurococcales archaeon]